MRKTGIMLLIFALLLISDVMGGGIVSATDHLVNTGVVGVYPSVSGDIIAYTSTRWGGEIQYYDTATGNATSSGQSTPELISVSGDIIVFWTAEWYSGQDLNGDGDANDRILSYYDISTGDVTLTPPSSDAINGDAPSFSGSIIAYHTR
jgi:hypothetical protein